MKGNGLIASGNLDLNKIITHRFSFNEFEKSMELMGKEICDKVVLYLNN